MCSLPCHSGNALRRFFVHKPVLILRPSFFIGDPFVILKNYQEVMRRSGERIEFYNQVTRLENGFKMCMTAPAHGGFKETTGCAVCMSDTPRDWEHAAEELCGELAVFHSCAAFTYQEEPK